MFNLVSRSIFNVNHLIRLHQPTRSLITSAARFTSHQHFRDNYRPDNITPRVLLPQNHLNPLYNSVSIRTLRYSAVRPAVGNQTDDGKPKDRPAADAATKESPLKVSLFQRFKQMYKDYWYVLIPVHVVTSIGWTGIFYYSVKNGLDVTGLLESWGVSEKIVNPLKKSDVGYYALTYAMYKVASPLRYTVTLAGTTVSINYLQSKGYIKPVPSRQQMQDMYQNRKDQFNLQNEELKRKLREHRAKIQKKMNQHRAELKKRMSRGFKKRVKKSVQ